MRQQPKLAWKETADIQIDGSLIAQLQGTPAPLAA
jgi:hypothetical protein